MPNCPLDFNPQVLISSAETAHISISKDPIEGGYTVSIPDLPGCITCCEKWEDVPAMIEDAKKCWLEAMLENESIQERDRNR